MLTAQPAVCSAWTGGGQGKSWLWALACGGWLCAVYLVQNEQPVAQGWTSCWGPWLGPNSSHCWTNSIICWPLGDIPPFYCPGPTRAALSPLAHCPQSGGHPGPASPLQSPCSGHAELPWRGVGAVLSKQSHQGHTPHGGSRMHISQSFIFPEHR